MPTPTEEAQLLAQAGSDPLPVGVLTTAATQPYAQTFDRRFATGAAYQTVSGTMVITAIWLPAGKVVTAISLVSGATGEAGGTNLWVALFRGDTKALLAQSTNDTGATSFAANTCLRKALATAQTLPYTGLYYIGYCSTNSAGTNPTLVSVNAAVANTNGSITGMTPVLAATADTGLTTTAPATAGALTAIVQSVYGFID